WIQISSPVAASSATSEKSRASTYITPLATIGPQTYETLSDVGYVQATSSWETFSFVIWSSVEKRALSGPPPQSLQVRRSIPGPCRPPAGRRRVPARATQRALTRLRRWYLETCSCISDYLMPDVLTQGGRTRRSQAALLRAPSAQAGYRPAAGYPPRESAGTGGRRPRT